MIDKALISSVTTYACLTWEYAADTHLLKLQRLQNRALRAMGNRDRCTTVREFYVAFKILSCMTIYLSIYLSICGSTALFWTLVAFSFS
jgi:hypothetical protein